MPEELQLPEIFFVSRNGILKNQDLEIPISGISAYLSENGVVIIEGTISATHSQDINNFDIIFQDKNGWSITAKNFSIFEENVTIQAGAISGQPSATFKSRGWKLVANRGEINEDNNVNIYNILTDIEFASEVKIDGFRDRGVKFILDELKDLVLIKTNISQVPRSVGYFSVNDKLGVYETKWKGCLDNLLLILRFAASNYINAPIIYINSSTGAERIEITSCIEYEGHGSRIFYLSYPGTISELVNSTYKQFVSMRQDLDLDKLIMYYIMMKNSHFVDNSYLLGCVFMEGLKYSFARNIKRIPYDTRAHKFLKPDGKTKYNFDELIRLLYSEFDINHGSTAFIRYRNEVIHEGAISSIGFKDILLEKQELEITIEHLLLNILKYEGLYWDKPSRQWVDYKSIDT